MDLIKMVPLSDIVVLRLEIARLSELATELAQKLNMASLKQTSQNVFDKGILVYGNKIKKYIKYDELIMIKAESNYSIIFYKNGHSALTSKTLKYWEERCEVDFLRRTHKSYIINLKMIKSYEILTKNILLEDGHIALYSRSNKKIISELCQPQ
ncbi:MAG: LytTR family transcriptional regulator [Saprospiraceae bacterium]|nr:LytTR family transcriptional regulator [Saprospiraceae bacterium]